MGQVEISRSPIDRVVRHLGLDHVVQSVRVDRRGTRAVLRGSDDVLREVDCEFGDTTWTLFVYSIDLEQETTTTLRPNFQTRMRIEMTDETSQRLRYMSGARGVSVDELVEDLVRVAMEGDAYERTEPDEKARRKCRAAHP